MTNSEKSNKIDPSKKHFMTPGQYIIVFFFLFIGAILVMVYAKNDLSTGTSSISSNIPDDYFPKDRLADVSGEVWLVNSTYVNSIVDIFNISTVTYYRPPEKTKSKDGSYITYSPLPKPEISHILRKELPDNVVIYNSKGQLWQLGEENFCVQGTMAYNIVIFQTNSMKKPLLGTCPKSEE